MATYLSQEWLDLEREARRELPEWPGASARVQYVVTGGPDGDVRYHARVESGAIVESALGDDPDAELTLTTPYDVSVKILKGELDANAAFMQGKVKVAGNARSLMRLMPLTQSPEFKAIQTKVVAATDL